MSKIKEVIKNEIKVFINVVFVKKIGDFVSFKVFRVVFCIWGFLIVFFIYFNKVFFVIFGINKVVRAVIIGIKNIKIRKFGFFFIFWNIFFGEIIRFKRFEGFKYFIF